MSYYQKKNLRVVCPQCQKIVDETDLVKVNDGRKKLLGFIPIPSSICENCIQEHNNKVEFNKKNPARYNDK